MSVQRHDVQQENVGAYLLGALSEFEESAFLRHLEECPVCRDEVDRLRPVVDALPRAVMPIAPPSNLKASIMAVVEAEARMRGHEPEVRRRRRPLVSLRRGAELAGQTFAIRRPAAAWVASFCLLVGVGTGYAVTQITSTGADTKAVVAQIDKSRLPSASGSLMVSSDSSRRSGILRVNGMPALEGDSTYQVWVKRDGEVIPDSLFSVGPDGRGAAAVSENLDGAEAVLVTREQVGGARAPSEDPVLSVTL